MTSLELHQRSARMFADALDGVGDDDWAKLTPCSEWSVRALVEHVVRWEMFLPKLIAALQNGEGLDAAAESHTAIDVFGADPRRAWADAAANSASVIAGTDLGTRVSHPWLGEVPLQRFVTARCVDNALHAWDLGAALGLDVTINEADAVVLCDALPDLPWWAGQRSDAAAPADRLLFMSGRHPNWAASRG